MIRHVHVLGIGGTFMAGLAQLAQALGWRVTGSDGPLWPPMSDQLRAAGIDWVEDLHADDPEPLPEDAEIVVGNVCKRGMVVIERLLDSGRTFTSGPEWLARNVLAGRWVFAVAGTHGKTTTASLLAHLLDDAGLDPGFLIGGVPKNFGVSARVGSDPFFVVEADEYDSAFFDKRAKFVHYHPVTTILNNLEFDHADIYPDLAAIQTQFHHLVRTVPQRGCIIVPTGDSALEAVLEMGVWTPVERVATGAPDADAHAHAGNRTLETGRGHAPGLTIESDGADHVRVHGAGSSALEGRFPLAGRHNRANLIAALAAARHAGVPLAIALEAASRFEGVARRLEVRGSVGGIVVIDDFAHHPTAIRETLDAVNGNLPASGRTFAIVEPRSNTMRMGVHAAALGSALERAARTFLFKPASIQWSTDALQARLGERLVTAAAIDTLIDAVVAAARPGDHLVVMSNGGFEGIHARLLTALREAEGSLA